jgi:hypothetical protein
MAFDTNLLLSTAAQVITIEQGVYVKVVVTAASGTTPTMDITIQDSPDNSAWKTRVTFDQIITTGAYRNKVFTKQAYIRAVFTIGGTTPSFTVTAGLDTGSEYLGGNT